MRNLMTDLLSSLFPHTNSCVLGKVRTNTTEKVEVCQGPEGWRGSSKHTHNIVNRHYSIRGTLAKFQPS